ncbi:hypothetical protein [Haloarcula argentinensis]|uniref:Uncharacterized protein n=1 Tax=Haloarcula argentinensis TaxID=43776 RepID=A0A830FS37_HALAR|nr:hypothetical protein [Haloarcula argentinensis]EMA25219.1 hypothetical protein C443_03449 [Haloarcula argentinensis DSM 12282]MDS0255985.1 hypothetical protein [Haloarcula argentinensis]GGM53111.1 hypothetical protein GCM10009006_37820 [Haloarcula argentinensis]
MSCSRSEGPSQPTTPQFVESIATTVPAQSESADREAVVLRAVARQSDSIALPDILELRSLIDVDGEQADTVEERVTTIITAIEAELAGWERWEVLA